MCGTIFCYRRGEPLLPSQACLRALRRRGPDSSRTVSNSVGETAVSSQDLDSGHPKEPVFFTYVSAILSLRGNTITYQPLEDLKSGSLLCWNGEAWKIQGSTVVGNDSQAVFENLLKLSKMASGDQALPNLLAFISSIAGPFAFVFYDARHQKIYYGRDVLGRRSLVIKNALPNHLIISSICDEADSKDWTEVEANGIYMLDLQADPNDLTQNPNGITHFPWENRAFRSEQSFTLLSPFPDFNSNVEGTATPSLALDSPAVDHLAQKLRSSLYLRLHNSTLSPSANSSCTSSARIAILFSGGLDCTVVARLAHDIIPMEQEIDLLNVAFENPRVIQAAASERSTAFDLCPDRITGLSSYAELLQICPCRRWRFVATNISYTELQAHRNQIISLIHPHNTEMDFSIACALYFAARGSGVILDAQHKAATLHTTSARILLSGLGADELFGGYTRHAIAFNRHGYTGLVSELKLDFSRLGKRNLGRDDRVISHWGKEARYPYLDEDLVSWALSIPVWEKCGFGETQAAQEDHIFPDLEPGKKLLRLLAWKLGMHSAASEKKRAIQFGARTAKMESGRKKGTAILERDP